MGKRRRSPSTIRFDVEPGGPILLLGGSITGASLQPLADAMDVVLQYHQGRFIVDVGDVDEWSSVAQAVLLATARRKAAHGEQLVLRGASPTLREQSQVLGLFEPIRSIRPQPADPIRDVGGVPGERETYAARPPGASTAPIP